MPTSLRLFVPFVLLGLAACQPSPVVAPAPGAGDETQRLRVENERLRRAAVPAPEAFRGETVEELATDLGFESGSATLSETGRGRLDTLAGRLRRDFGGRRIRVEGHSDDQRIGPSLRAFYPTNWELSGARASAVVRYLIDVHRFDPARLEAVGMSAYAPVVPNDTPEGKARNRRVRVAVLPGS